MLDPEGHLLEFGFQLVKPLLAADVHVVELGVDHLARVGIDLEAHDVDLRLAALIGATAERPRLQEVFAARRIQLRVQHVHREQGRTIAGPGLHRQRRAQTFLAVLQAAIARDARVVGARGVRQDSAILETAVSAGRSPAHRAETFLQTVTLAVGDREQSADLVIRPGVRNQTGEARAPVLRQIVVAVLARQRALEAHLVEWTAGAQIDGRPQRPLFRLGRGGLAHRDIVEEL